MGPGDCLSRLIGKTGLITPDPGPIWFFHFRFYGNVQNRMALGKILWSCDLGCTRVLLATTSLRVTEGSSCVERCKGWEIHAKSNDRYWMLLTDTCSESVGPSTRFRWTATCSLGDVCYMHRPHVHPRLHCQTSQVCHVVSDMRPLQCFLQPVTVPPPLASWMITKSCQADGQWHIPFQSFGTAMRTHALPQHGSTRPHSSIVEASPARWTRFPI